MSPVRKNTIALVGPCGVGKSTFASQFNGIPGVDVILESAPNNLPLDTPYSCIDIYQTQRTFLESRVQSATAARGSTLIFDRYPTEDIAIFLKLHHELGGISSRQYTELKEYALSTCAIIGQPNMTVVLRATKNALLSRIDYSNRPNWLIDSYRRQLELYDDFISNLRGDLIEIDTTHLAISGFESRARLLLDALK